MSHILNFSTFKVYSELYRAPTQGGLQHIHISGGSTRGASVLPHMDGCSSSLSQSGTGAHQRKAVCKRSSWRARPITCARCAMSSALGVCGRSSLWPRDIGTSSYPYCPMQRPTVQTMHSHQEKPPMIIRDNAVTNFLI